MDSTEYTFMPLTGDEPHELVSSVCNTKTLDTDSIFM